MKEVKISQVDALFSNGSYPIEFLFGYGKGFPTKKLRKALRKLAPIFWPFFGEYMDGTILSDKYREVDCFSEETVPRALDISEIKAAGSEALWHYRQNEMKKLFFLKAVRFKDGVLLIPRLNHLAGDGYSYFTFLSALASLSRPSLNPLKSIAIKSMFAPHHRRTALKDFAFGGVKLAPVAQDARLTVTCDEIPKPEVQSLIREAASSDNLRISTNDILSAMAVRKLVEVQREYWGENVRLTIPIDVRRQVREYGPRFLGNGIMLHTIVFDKEQIIGSPVKETAARLRKTIPSLSSETYINYLEGLEKIISAGQWNEFRPFDPSRGCLVTNLSKLPAERLDFGTGAPELIMPLTVEKNSTAILSQNENYVLRFSF